MKFGNKFRHGSAAIAITVAVIVAVVLLNVGLTALTNRNLIFGDLTSESVYTLNSETTFLLDQTFESVRRLRAETGEEEAKVEIIFCTDVDLLTRNQLMRYVYYTARSLAKKYPEIISVRTVDVWSNPSAVDAYRTNSYSSIYQSSVIVASGSEYRILSLKNFYTYSSDTDTEPWAYSGERIFTRTIMAVTKAEAPICGITVNHGEPFGEGYADAEGNPRYAGLLATVKGAGYRVQYLDLAADDIPEDCRLILVFDPKTDFTSGSYLSGSTGEVGKLDAFLAKSNSLMVFVNADTPSLPNFEEFLEDWGVAFDRYRDPVDELTVLGNYKVISPRDSVDSANTALLATYETEGTGGSVTSSMRETGAAPKVVFPNAMPLRYSPSYSQTYYIPTDENSASGAYTYGSYYRNAHSRSVYDVFRSSGSGRGTYAVAQDFNGETLTDGGNPISNADGNYKLATLTSEVRIVGEGQGYTNVNDNSYVCAFGSTAFADNELLLSNAYGNTDVLLQVLRTIGREVVGVGLKFEPMYDAEITQINSSTGRVYYTEAGNAARTVVLALIPVVLAAGTGTWVLVRRRFAR